MRDWDPDFEQIVLLYKPLSKCPRQQRNMDGALIGFIWPPKAHGHQWKIRTIWVQHWLILMIHAIGRAYFWHNLLVYFWVGVGEVQ